MSLPLTSPSSWAHGPSGDTGVRRSMAQQTIDIDELYRRYARPVSRRIRRFYSDPATVDDVLQEVFLRVLENQHKFSGESRPSTWLYTVTTRHCLNRLRDGKRRSELLAEHGSDMGWGGLARAPSQPSALLLRQIWRELDSELLEIAVYYEIDGMTQAQIAEVMGVSRRTVGNRLVELTRRANALAGEET